MKLLLDENLSRRLVPLLIIAYPNTSQVALLALETSTDREIQEYAKKHDFTIVTRDSDYYELSTLYGAPPKIIWLKTGNQSNAATLKNLLDQRDQVLVTLLQEGKNCIEIY